MNRGILKQHISKSLAILLAVALAVTNVNVTTFAAETQNSKKITQGSNKGTAKNRKKEQKNVASGSAVSVDKSKLEKLQKRIDALPTVDEFIALADGTTVEDSTLNQAQLDVYNEAQAIAEEMDKLTDEEQAQLDTEKLETLFEYFNGQVEKSDSGWSLSDDGVLTITDADLLNNNYVFDAWNGNQYVGGNVPPWYSRKDYKNTTIKKVKIECKPTIIGSSAFRYCSELTEVNIPDSATTIGEEAFKYCSSLREVTIPGSVTTIGVKAFYSCTKLTKVNIQNGVTTIGEAAFSDCTSLREVTIPGSVTTIDYQAFNLCTRACLKNILNCLF